jgi:prepilin-type N-terminal cleavage/methylation domain-containing protein
MNHTHLFKNTTYRGFTLIELLVVIAIIGLLSTIIAAPIQNARKKARDSKKIAEIKAVQLALDQYAEANAGSYPYDLLSLAPTYMPQLPGFAATTSPTISPRDMFAYTPYTISGVGIKTTNFAYHLGTHLENFSQGLDNDRDCAGAENIAGFTIPAPITVGGNPQEAASSTCAFYPAVGGAITSTYISSAPGGMIPKIVGTFTGSIGGGATSDFSGGDNNTKTCNATYDCVFDVNGQQ